MRLVIDLQGAQGSSRLRGIGRYSRELALAMARHHRGHDVIVALNATLEDGLDELCGAFRDVLPETAIHLWWGPSGAAEVVAARAARTRGGEWLRAHALAALRPDVLLVTSVFEGAGDDVISRWPSTLSRLPTAAVCYDLIPLVQRADYLDSAWSGGLKDWYLRRLHELSLADALLAISEASRNDAIDHIGYPADRIRNISAGIDPHFRPPAPDQVQQSALFARYGLREGFILFVGGGDQRKNEAGLIRAHGLLPPALRRRHPLAIVGKVDTVSLNAAARAAGLSPDELILIRFVEEADLPALYAACFLFVLPSSYEGFGLPAAEAMACGAPTLGSNTASLPEVIGMPEATFDPADPADMARCIERGLLDEAFRQRLRAHAPVQAARFSWQNTAVLAWETIERLFPGKAWTMPRRLPRLAVTTPLPPLPTGIADYSRQLVPALSRHYDITLVTPGGSTNDELLLANYRILDPEGFRTEVQHFDRILHQVGNSHFHAFQLEELLPAFGGAVVLHDSFLSGVERWRAVSTRDPRRFLQALHDAHGWPAVRCADREGEEVAVSRYPMSLPVLRDADLVIQHSAHGLEVLRAHFGDAATRGAACIPLLRPPLPPPDQRAARERLKQPSGRFLVASFGAIASTKLPDRLLAAWRRAAPSLPGASLVLVGEVAEDSAELVADLPESGPGGVLLTGRVSRNEYLDWLQAADMAVQLRTRSRGESSGALFDCLAAGLPCIANANGAMAELPENTVVMLPDAFTDDELVAALLKVSGDAEARKALRTNARAYARENLSPQFAAQRYAAAMEAAHDAHGSTAAHLMACARVPPGDGDDLAALATAAVACIPARRPPLLMLDQSLLSQQAEAPSVALIRRLLLDHAPDLRVELAQCDVSGGWRTMPAATQELLSLRVPGLVPRDVAAAPGDVILLMPDLEASAARKQQLRRLRRRGTAILCWTLREDAEAMPETDGLLRAPRGGRAEVIRARAGKELPAWLHALPWTD